MTNITDNQILYDIKPPYIFKYDNEFDNMVKNNIFQSFFFETMLSFWIIIIYNKNILDKLLNLYNFKDIDINHISGTTLDEIIKFVKKISYKERNILFNYKLIEKEWLSILYIFRKINKCFQNNCKFKNCVYGLHENEMTNIICHFNILSDNGCKNYCKKKHIFDNKFWINIRTDLIKIQFNKEIISTKIYPTLGSPINKVAFVGDSFASLLINSEENNKFEEIKKIVTPNNICKKKIKKISTFELEYINFNDGSKGNYSNFETIILNPLDNNLEEKKIITSSIKINKVIKKKKVLTLSDSDFNNCISLEIDPSELYDKQQAIKAIKAINKNKKIVTSNIKIINNII
jgi:hypothetical protein